MTPIPVKLMVKHLYKLLHHVDEDVYKGQKSSPASPSHQSQLSSKLPSQTSWSTLTGGLWEAESAALHCAPPSPTHKFDTRTIANVDGIAGRGPVIITIPSLLQIEQQCRNSWPEDFSFAAMLT
jgi:hypothetical protein